MEDSLSLSWFFSFQIIFSCYMFLIVYTCIYSQILLMGISIRILISINQDINQDINQPQSGYQSRYQSASIRISIKISISLNQDINQDIIICHSEFLDICLKSSIYSIHGQMMIIITNISCHARLACHLSLADVIMHARSGFKRDGWTSRTEAEIGLWRLSGSMHAPDAGRWAEGLRKAEQA